MFLENCIFLILKQQSFNHNDASIKPKKCLDLRGQKNIVTDLGPKHQPQVHQELQSTAFAEVSKCPSPECLQSLSKQTERMQSECGARHVGY